MGVRSVSWKEMDLMQNWRQSVNAQLDANDISLAWPVGSAFLHTSETNPSTLLGFGTWERNAPPTLGGLAVWKRTA